MHRNRITSPATSTTPERSNIEQDETSKSGKRRLAAAETEGNTVAADVCRRELAAAGGAARKARKVSVWQLAKAAAQLLAIRFGAKRSF